MDTKPFAKDLDDLAKQLLTPYVYKRFGVKGLRKMDDRIIRFLLEFRKDVGVPLIVNGNMGGKSFTQSGLRDDVHYGSYTKMKKSLSDHCRGAGIDIKSYKLSGHELRAKFIEKEKYYYEKYGVNFIECAPLSTGSSMSWMHISIRFSTEEGVMYWSPKNGFVSKEKVLENKW